MPVYKNLTDQDQVISGIGICLAGQTIDSPLKIESANFQEETQPQVQTPVPQIIKPLISENPVEKGGVN